MKTLIGHYRTGTGHAHLCCQLHNKLFKCEMFGTFNIVVATLRILEYEPAVTTAKANYYFIELKKNKKKYYGWAVRDHTSHQGENVLEVLTKKLLPDSLKEGDIEITVLQKWNLKQITSWAKERYWFQTFPFTPKKRADSKFLWDIINHIPWSGKNVLDIGAHYGYFAFEASKAGAQVIGFESNKASLKMAKIIRDNIIHQDIQFVAKDPGGNFDIILYLSVHHQPDPEYKKLIEKITELKSRAKDVFIELILPPMFPKKSTMTEQDIDKIIDGEIKAVYKHRVRGMRKVYHCKGDRQ